MGGGKGNVININVKRKESTKKRRKKIGADLVKMWSAPRKVIRKELAKKRKKKKREIFKERKIATSDRGKFKGNGEEGRGNRRSGFGRFPARKSGRGKKKSGG